MKNDLSEHKTACNESTGWLKVIAFVFMVIDHLGVVFFPDVREWRLFGRIAFPLYAWCLTVGAAYTRNIYKYALRLLLVGLISQPLSVWAFQHSWMDLNIYFTLLLGLFAIYGIRANRYGSSVLCPLMAYLCTFAFQFDYGWKGITLIIAFYLLRNCRAGLGIFYAVFCLFWGYGTFSVSSVFGIPLLKTSTLFPNLQPFLTLTLRVQFYAILALPLILVRFPDRLKMPKTVGYALYPAHLLIIGLIRVFLAGFAA